MTENQTPKTTNIPTELAKERSRASAERTLMAWIRTGLSLISFGFGIAKFVPILERTSGLSMAQIVGLSFIALGILSMILAMYQHRRELRHILQVEYVFKPRLSLGSLVAALVILIGILSFVIVVIKIK